MTLNIQDRDSQLYEITSIVYWIAATATATIIVTDFNDNPPKFVPDLYQKQVSELAGPLSFIVQMDVIDADSDAVFVFELNVEATKNFTIDTEGSIFIRDQQVANLSI